MRVLHVAESFSQTSETFIYDLVTELEEKGIENHVLTTKRVSESERPFPRVSVVPFPTEYDPERLLYLAGEKLGLYDRGDSFRKALRWRFASVVCRASPDVIHAHFGPMGVLMKPVTRELEIPLVVSFLGFDFSVLLTSDFWIQKYRGLAKRDVHAHVISNHLGEKARRIGFPARRVHVVHYGIRPDTFAPNSEKQENRGTGENAPDAIRCLHVGRLVEKKGPVHLIRAFRNACDQVGEKVSLRLTIAGDGPLRGRVEEEVETRGIGNHVELLGAVPHEQVADLMHESDIYTQHCVTAPNGDEEGMGVTFAEASAAGLPVVATRHNGIPDVVKHEETGFLVAEGDENAMGHRIGQLATDPELRRQLGENGRRHVEQNFRLDRQVEKMIRLYELIRQE